MDSRGLELPSGARSDFGYFIALSDDALAAGLRREPFSPDDLLDHGPGAYRGGVAVWLHERDSWRALPMLRPPAIGPGAHWNSSIAVKGDVLTVGSAMTHWPKGGGYVHVYRRHGSRFELETSLASPPEWPNNQYRNSVCMFRSRPVSWWPAHS